MNNIAITKLQKSCRMYFCIFILFQKSTQILPYFAASPQHLHVDSMPEYAKHMLLNTLHVFYIYNKNNVRPFRIFYTKSIFSFPSCV